MTIREWTHVERSALAFHATRGPTLQYVVSTRGSEHGVPAEIDTTIRFWGDGAGRFREERENYTMVGDSVSVWSLFHDDALHNFSVEEAAERLLAWRTDEPRVLSVDGVEVRVVDGSRPGPPTEVHLERGGTHVRISSDTLDAERLVAVAGSLVQASTEAPPIF